MSASLPALGPSPLVRREVERRFGPRDAPAVLRQLEATPLPLLERADRQRERDRVHLAVLKEAASDPARVPALLALAARDWRDLLVGAGLADADWPRVLSEAGFPVP